MDYAEKFGKTVEEAVELAANDLGLTKDDVSFEVLEEPTKGFLGIGAKLAKVRVKVANKADQVANKFLGDVFEKMGIDIKYTCEAVDDTVVIGIEGKDAGIVIGKRGHTLDSLQYLTSLVVNKNKENYTRIIINAESYRQKREKTLIDLANRLAKKVGGSGRSIRLEPMNPYERRIIHSALQNNARVVTKSEGEDPYRRVVIERNRSEKK